MKRYWKGRKHPNSRIIRVGNNVPSTEVIQKALEFLVSSEIGTKSSYRMHDNWPHQHSYCIEVQDDTDIFLVKKKINKWKNCLKFRTSWHVFKKHIYKMPPNYGPKKAPKVVKKSSN
jgi:hypothetical protein